MCGWPLRAKGRPLSGLEKPTRQSASSRRTAALLGLIFLPDLLNFRKPPHHKKERVRHVVRQMSGKNMAGNIRRVSRGASQGNLSTCVGPGAGPGGTSGSPSIAGPGVGPGGGDDKPAIATVEGVALSDASTAVLTWLGEGPVTTTSGVVVTGA